MTRSAIASRSQIVTNQNLFTWSTDQTNAAWVKAAMGITGGQADPFGGTNACKAVPTAGNASHQVTQVTTAVTGSLLAYSMYAKPSGYSLLLFRGSSGATVQATFDITNGTISSVNNGHTASITSAGNGWFLCTVIYEYASGTSLRFGIGNVDNTTIFTADGTSGCFVYGLQANYGRRALLHTTTTTTALNPTGILRSGLTTARSLATNRIVP